MPAQRLHWGRPRYPMDVGQIDDGAVDLSFSLALL
jgi:hypothetical protein